MLALWTIVALAAPDEGVAALDAYAARRLAVVERDVTTVYASAYDGNGRFWFVAQGEARLLSTVELAQLVGDVDGARWARGRQRLGIVGGAVMTGLGAALGVAAVGIGGPALLNEGDFPTVALATGISVGAAGSLVGGPLLIGRGLRGRHPSSLYTQDEAERWVEDHNASLRDELLGTR